MYRRLVTVALVAAHSRERLYLGCSTVIRLVWLMLGLSSFVIHGVSVAAFSAEFLVMVFLTYEAHPILLKGLDPKPDDSGNFFMEDTGIKFLVTTAVIAYFVPLTEILGVHLPHGIGKIVHHYVASETRAWLILFGGLLCLSPIFGLYLSRAEPQGAIIRRASGAVLGHEPDDLYAEDQQELHDALESAERSAKDWTVIGVHSFVIGLMVALTALGYGLVFASIFQIPRILILIVILWLGHDILQHQFDLEAGLGHFLREFGEEIEQPKRWFLEVEMIEGGLKGILMTLFIGIGIAFTGLLLSTIFKFTFTSFDALIQTFSLLWSLLVTEGVSRFLSKPTQVLTIANAVLVFITVGALAPITGAVSAVVWYAILDRVPYWTADFHYESETEPAEARPLSNALLIAYLFAWLAFSYTLVVLAPMASAETFIANIYFLIALIGLVLWELIPTFLLYRALKSFDRQRISGTSLNRDNHIILGLLLFPTLALIPVGTYSLRAVLGLLLVGILGYYFADVLHYINKRLQSKIKATVVFQVYVVLFVGIVFAAGLMKSIEIGYLVRFLIWILAGLLALDWIVTLFID